MIEEVNCLKKFGDELYILINYPQCKSLLLYLQLLNVILPDRLEMLYITVYPHFNFYSLMYCTLVSYTIVNWY